MFMIDRPAPPYSGNGNRSVGLVLERRRLESRTSNARRLMRGGLRQMLVQL